MARGRRRSRNRRNRKYGPGVTAILILAMILIASVYWSLFVSGPSRVYEKREERIIAGIMDENARVKGLTRHEFNYVTYQGYTEDTLYWFNEKSDLITTRSIDSLDYEKAKQVALDQYKIECDTITLGYGYNSPVYEIRGSGKMLLLDYDTLIRVYERAV